MIARFLSQDLSERRFNVGTPVHFAIILTILLSMLDSASLFIRDKDLYFDYLYIRLLSYHSLLIVASLIFITGPSLARFRISLVLITSAVAFSMLFYMILLTKSSVAEYIFIQNGLIFFLFGSFIAVDRRWALVCLSVVYLSILFAALNLLPDTQRLFVAWNLSGMFIIAIALGTIIDDFRTRCEIIILQHKIQIGELRLIEDFTTNVLKQGNHAIYARRPNGDIRVNFSHKEFKNIEPELLNELFKTPADHNALFALFGHKNWRLMNANHVMKNNVLSQIIIQEFSGKTFVASMMRLPDNTLALHIVSVPLPNGDISQISQGFKAFGMSIFEFNQAKKNVQKLGTDLELLRNVENFEEFFEILNQSGLDKNAFYLGKPSPVHFLSEKYWVQHNSPSLLDDSHSFQVLILKAHEFSSSVGGMQIAAKNNTDLTMENLTLPKSTYLQNREKFARTCLVDDNFVLLKSLGHLMRLAGIHVDLVSSCEAFWKNVNAGANYKIVIMDFHISDNNGIDFGKEILHHNPETKCILLSGEISSGEEAIARQSGFCETLIKPIGLEQLQDIIVKFDG